MSNRNRILVVSLCLIALLQPSQGSNASPSGCPIEWSIPKNLLESTLEQRTELLAPSFDTVIKPSKDAEYSFDGTNWMKVKNGASSALQWTHPDPLAQRDFDVSFLRGFFGNRYEDLTLISLADLSWLKQEKIYIRTTIEISKQNCDAPRTFQYEKIFSPPGIEYRKFEDELLKLKDSFPNYQVFNSVIATYKSCIEKWESNNFSTSLKKPIEYCGMGNYSSRDISVELIPETPNCLEFLPGNKNVPSGVGIKPGTICTYNILGFIGDPAPLIGIGKKRSMSISAHYNPNSDNLVSFGRITINSKAKNVKISCVKGKITKVVSGINPKCPTGYKKK